MRIVCYISGGVLQGVWTSDPNVTVDVWDDDNIEGGDEPPADSLEDLTEGMVCVY